MKIRHYLYNAFLLQEGSSKIAIDPGQNLALFKLHSLIPEQEWPDITHILITHGDPDHYWQADRVAQASGGYVVCGKGLTKAEEEGVLLLVAPRGRGLKEWVHFDNAYPMETGDQIVLDGVAIEAVKSVHGSISIPLLGFNIRQQPGPGERVGLGSTGFKITLGDTTVVNLGDSIFQQDWQGLSTDVLMLPIGGGGNNAWTMDTREALQAVRLIEPRLVIPCHYNVPFLWVRNAAPADGEWFKSEVEKLGVECRTMGLADEIEI